MENHTFKMPENHLRRAFVILTLEFRKEDRYWVGRCVELGTATDGRSLQRVERELTKLVTLHLNGLEDIGEREGLFRERGITLYTDQVPEQINRTVPVSADDTLIQLKPIPLEIPDTALVGA